MQHTRFSSEQILPKNKLIAFEGDKVCLAQIFAVGVQPQCDVVLIVDQFFFGVDFQRECFEIARGLLFCLPV